MLKALLILALMIIAPEPVRAQCYRFIHDQTANVQVDVDLRSTASRTAPKPPGAAIGGVVNADSLLTISSGSHIRSESLVQFSEHHFAFQGRSDEGVVWAVVLAGFGALPGLTRLPSELPPVSRFKEAAIRIRRSSETSFSEFPINAVKSCSPREAPILFALTSKGEPSRLRGWVAFDSGWNVTAARIYSEASGVLFARHPFARVEAPVPYVLGPSPRDSLMFRRPDSASPNEVNGDFRIDFRDDSSPAKPEGAITLHRLQCDDLRRVSVEVEAETPNEPVPFEKERARVVIAGYTDPLSKQRCGIELRYYPGWYVTADMAALACGGGAWSYSQQMSTSSEPLQFDPPPGGCSGNGYGYDCGNPYPYYRDVHRDHAKGWDLVSYTPEGTLKISDPMSEKRGNSRFNDSPAPVKKEDREFVTKLVMLPLSDSCKNGPVRINDGRYACAAIPSDLPDAKTPHAVAAYMHSQAIITVRWKWFADGRIVVLDAGAPRVPPGVPTRGPSPIGFVAPMPVNPECKFTPSGQSR